MNQKKMSQQKKNKFFEKYQRGLLIEIWDKKHLKKGERLVVYVTDFTDLEELENSLLDLKSLVKEECYGKNKDKNSPGKDK